MAAAADRALEAEDGQRQEFGQDIGAGPTPAYNWLEKVSFLAVHQHLRPSTFLTVRRIGSLARVLQVAVRVLARKVLDLHISACSLQLIRWGAAQAPCFTEALLHERLRSSSSSSALQRHSLLLLAEAGSGRGIHNGSQAAGPLMGLQALNYKSQLFGRVGSLFQE